MTTYQNTSTLWQHFIKPHGGIRTSILEIRKRILRRYPLLLLLLAASVSARAQSIELYTKSKSKFDNTTVLSSHQYPASAIYRAYKRAGTGFVPLSVVRRATEEKIESFARERNKAFFVLGEQTSSPPYILGNFPRIEIVFALVESGATYKADKHSSSSSERISQLERLKKLFDDGALTKEEYEQEKKKVLAEN